MNKQDLAAVLAEKHGLTKSLALEVVESLVDTVVEQVAKGGKVSLSGLGTFGVQETKARDGRNPQTGKAIKIEASRRVKFQVAAGFKTAVKQ